MPAAGNKKSADVRIARIAVILGATQLARLDVARDQRGFARARRRDDPHDGTLARLIQPLEKTFAQHGAMDLGSREFGQRRHRSSPFYARFEGKLCHCRRGCGQ